MGSVHFGSYFLDRENSDLNQGRREHGSSDIKILEVLTIVDPTKNPKKKNCN